MKLRCQSEDITTLHDYSSLSSLLAQRFCLAEDPVPSLPTIRSLAVQFSFYSTDFIFSAPHCDCGHLLSDLQCEVHWCRNIPLQLVIGLTRSSGQFNPVTGYVRCIISAKYVEGVDIDGCTFPGNFWVDTLGHFQELR
ncbi:hypothetical protein OG21DRAFT_1514296 [Imleria badia]|nr:hypothetical protein OG21DRAFT_1514296 [Imleria badia]